MAAWVLPAAAEDTMAAFGPGFDLGAALEAAPAAPEANPAKLGVFTRLRATKGCKFISFRADSPAVSEPVTLTSHVFEKVCEVYQDGKHCYEKLLRRERRKVYVELTGERTPLPWAREVFGICLEDTALSAEVAEASHKYRITKTPGKPLYRVEARAESRLPSPPDPAGIAAQAWSVPAGQAFPRLALADKWSAFYGAVPGAERTVLRLTLKQDSPGWFDGTILETELELEPAELYTVDFSLYAAQFRRPLEAGRQYYVKWSFSRRGGLSKGTWLNGGETGRLLLPAR